MARDLLLITPRQENSTWGLDINIVGGSAVLVPGDSAKNTQIQRVAVASYLCKGTIPGQEGVGADWPGFLAGKVALIDCDNQVKSNMEALAQASMLPESPYPLYTRDETGVHITLYALQTPAVNGVNS